MRVDRRLTSPLIARMTTYGGRAKWLDTTPMGPKPIRVKKRKNRK